MILGNPNLGRRQPTAASWLALIVTATPILAACLIVGLRRAANLRSSSIAIVVGALAGITALLTKIFVELLHEGVVAILTSGVTYGVIIVGLGGVYLQQLAFQAGSLRTSMPIIQVLEPLTAAALGVLLLQEHLRPSTPAIAVMALATILMILSTIALAQNRAETQKITRF